MVDTRDLKSLAQWGVRVRVPHPVLPTSTISIPLWSQSMKITASKVRQQFTQLLSQLSDGPIEITKHGKVVAVLALPDSLTTSNVVEKAAQATEKPARKARPSTKVKKPAVASETPSRASESESFRAKEESEEAEGVEIWGWSSNESEDFERYLQAMENGHDDDCGIPTLAAIDELYI